MNTEKFSEHINLKNIVLTDKFWTETVEKVRREVIPYQLDALNDRVEGAAKSYSVENFIKAGKVVEKIKNGEEISVYPTDKWCYDENNSPEEAFHGWVFQDSDVYKWLEAVSYSLSAYKDEELENNADKLISLICKAQLENGYLDTLFIINDRNAAFTNLKEWHELYCFGHLAEAAVAYYYATGKNALLDVAYRFADLICETFGENKTEGYGGHEIAEMALVKLYKVSGNKRYLECARYFIEERGKKPYYYDKVSGKTTVDDNYHYYQAHIQPKYQTEAVGHAVRAVYLYSGMADIAKQYHDDELYGACKSLIDNIMNKKMYITGGIGSTVDGEAFSYEYDLSGELAYSETCASIGLIFFAQRMLEIEPQSEIADTIERALYNTVLSGMALDGKSFFYVNPLEVLPEACHKDSRKRHIKPIRQKWFGCACCPPNLARLISSVGEYICTENEDSIYVNQYISGKIRLKNAELEIDTSYCRDGKAEITVKPERPLTLALRIPSWCKKFNLSGKFTLKDGYAYFEINEECKIKAEFEIKVRLIKTSNRVRANIGRVAVTRGPFVYCLEEKDNGKNLQMIRLSKNSEFSIEDDIISTKAIREKENSVLYSDWCEEAEEEVTVKFIPYYKWANRGENEMSVFVRI